MERSQDLHIFHPMLLGKDLSIKFRKQNGRHFDYNIHPRCYVSMRFMHKYILPDMYVYISNFGVDWMRV